MKTAMKTTISTFVAALAFALSLPAAETEKKGITLGDALKLGRSAFHKGDFTTAKKYFLLVQKHKPGHETTRNYLAQIKVIEEERGGNPSLETKMKEMIIPKVNFEEATLREAVDYLVTTTATEDWRVNIVLKDLTPAQQEKRITLQLNSVPFSYVLKTVGALVGVKFQYQEYAIIGSPSS